LRAAIVINEKLVAKTPEEGNRPPLEAATKKRLVKTEKTLCVP
jgi:hypothetical protein